MGLSSIIRSVVGRSAGRGGAGTTRRTSGTGRMGYGRGTGGRMGTGRGGANRSGSGGVGGMIRSILNRR